MSKPITLEMLHAMSADQRKTLHANANRIDTPAARAVLELLAQDGLMPTPKVAKAATARKSPARTKTARAAKPSVEPAAKRATFGRQG